MKRGYLAAVLVVLAAASSVWADESSDGNMRTWLDGDYLLWWLSPAPTGPALLTTGPLTSPTSLGSGVLGAPNTSVLAGNSNFNQGPYSGFRISAGVMNCANTLGAEGSFFYLTQRGASESFGSNDFGNPLLARPIVDARSGNETVLFASAPGAFSGSFSALSSTYLFGFDANLLRPFSACKACYPDEVGYFVTGLAGFRYLNLHDDLTLMQSSNVLTNGIGFFDSLPISPGGNLAIMDDIRTNNMFYGGQIGVKGGVSWWRFSLHGTAKIALGSMREEAIFNGTTTATTLGGSATVPGGLYSLAPNAGSHNRNMVAFVPTGQLNFSVEITPQLRLTVGYTIIWISNVARPGNLIDRSINRTELPSSQTFNPTVPGPQNPAFNWNGTDFWAQGLNFALNLRF